MQKRGISLIVLVITIIVMIILAAAIIISLNNTGIISNANKAKDESDLANIKTAADLEYSEYILDKSVLPEGTTLGDYITEKLVQSGIIKGKNDWRLKANAFASFYHTDSKLQNFFKVEQTIDKSAKIEFDKWTIPGAGYVISYNDR